MQCPLCGSNVMRTQAFEKKINLYMQQKDDADKREKEFKHHIKILTAQLSESKVDKKKIEAEAIKKAERAASEKIKKIKEDADLKVQKKAEIIASKSARNIEEQLRKENALLLKREKAKLFEKAASEEKMKYQEEKLQSDKRERAYRIKLERAEKKVEDLNNQLKANNDVELKGEVQEDIIEDYVRNHFPGCDVTPVDKGKRGDDVHVTVIQSGKKIGTIGIESKDTKDYSSKWVENLKKGMTRDNLDYGIIISTSLPKGFSGIKWFFGGRIAMIKMNYSNLDLVLSGLIQTVIQLYQARKINSLSDTKQGELYKRITHPSLPLKIKSLLDSFMEESLLIDKDINNFEKSKGLRIKNHNDKKTHLKKVFSYISGGDETISSTLLGDSDEDDPKIIKIKSIKEEVIN